MWRRIPIVPALVGVFSGWALLAMLASRDPALSNGRVYASTGALAAVYALIAYAILMAIPRPRSRSDQSPSVFSSPGWPSSSWRSSESSVF